MIKKNLIKFGYLVLFVVFANFNSYKVYAEDVSQLLQQLETLQKDIKTLEKAVYSQDSSANNSRTEILDNSGDVLTKHLQSG